MSSHRKSAEELLKKSTPKHHTAEEYRKQAMVFAVLDIGEQLEAIAYALLTNAKR